MSVYTAEEENVPPLVLIKSEIDIDDSSFMPDSGTEPTVSHLTATKFEIDMVGVSSATTSAQEDNIPPLVPIPRLKLYDINRLHLFDTCFIVKRMEQQDILLSYSKAVSIVEEVLQRWRRANIPNGIGIAIRFGHHTVASCILTLAILNHECHFFPTDKLMLSRPLNDLLCRAGIQYLLASGHMLLGPAFFERVDTFLVYNEEYKLLKVLNAANYAKPVAPTRLPPNMCYTITTTGSTGEPKLVHVPYECIEPNIHGLSKKLKLCKQDIIYLGTPITFDPFVVEFFLALRNGATLLISHYSMNESPTGVLRMLFPSNEARNGVSVLQMTPSLFRQFGSTAIRERILSSDSNLRVLLLGGEPFPLNQELALWIDPQVLMQKLICNIYGISELSCWSMLYILQSLNTQVSLGVPIDDQTCIKIDYKNEPGQKTTGIGELLVGSATRVCYIPEIDNMNTKALDDSGYCFRATGDWVRRSEDGSLYYLGRTNNVVKRAGNRISLDNISKKINILTNELVTCLWEPYCQKLICCICTTESTTKYQQRAQTYHILAKLMAAEQPDRFVYLQHFPFNSHGKLDVPRLLKECLPLVKTGQDILKSFLHDTLECDETQQPTNTKRSKKEASSTKVVSNGYDQSFRQAGGTSFHAVTLSREIGMQMCIDDEQRHLFEMLLDESVPLRAVLLYLDNAKMVANNTKLKPVEMSLSASCSGSGNNSEITQLDKPTFKFKVKWTVSLKKCVDSSIAQLNDQFICVGAHSKMVRTMDANTGDIQSTITLPDRIECKVTFINEEMAIVGCYDGYLYAFHPLTGKFLWNVEIGGMIKAQPVMSSDGSRIVVCSYANDYNVMCISTNDQRIIWCINIGEKPIIASPLELPYENAVIICTLDGSYACVSLESGDVKWINKCKEPFFASPVLLDSRPSAKTFLCAEVIGRVHACSSSTGEITASFVAEGNIFSSLLTEAPPTPMGYTFVLFGCIDKYLYCLRCKTGANSVEFALQWKLDVGGSIYSTPILVTMQPRYRLVFCCATDGSAVLANLSDGQLTSSFKFPGEIFSTPCYIEKNGCIYIGCRDNYVYCLGMELLNQCWAVSQFT